MLASGIGTLTNPNKLENTFRSVLRSKISSNTISSYIGYLEDAFVIEEARRYEPGPDGTPRIASIDYAARPGVHADPMLIPRADWRDDYHYDAAGALTGWTRTRGDRREDFTPDGARLLAPATRFICKHPTA